MFSIAFRIIGLVCLYVFLLSTARADCVFVNTNSDPNTVAAFEVNADGSLSAVAGSPFATGGSGAFDAAVGSVGLNMLDSRLYVSNPSSDNVSGFDIAADCTLTALPGSPYAAGNSALGLTTDPEGNFLYVANFLDDSISVFTIAADGSLTPITGSPFTTPSTPFDIEFLSTGGRFFVSHDFAAAVGVYDQAVDGTFTPVTGSPFAAGGFQHGIDLNPAENRLYTADFGPDTITGYSIDGASGALTALPGSPFAAGVEPIEVLVDVSDSFLFATNDNAENIAVFAIDGAGALTPVTGSPFASDATGPAGLAQDSAGQFLYVANGGFSGSADVSVFTIAGDGSLTPISGSPFATGGTGNATGIAFLSQAIFSVGGTVSGLAAGNSVTLQNNGGDDLVINSDGGFSFDTLLSNGDDYAVTVLTQPPNQNCSVSNGTGTIAAADVTDVAVSCADLTIAIDTSSVDFGQVFIEETGFSTISITNSGNADVSISSINGPSEPFTIIGGSCNSTPLTLSPGQSCDLQLTFMPGSAGEFVDTIEVVSTAISSPDTITLRGSSVFEAFPVPTLNGWMLLMMILALLVVAGVHIRLKPN